MGFGGVGQSKKREGEAGSISDLHIHTDGGGGVRREEEKQEISGNSGALSSSLLMCVCVWTRVWMCERYLRPHTPLTAGDKHRPALLTTWFINMNFTPIRYLFLSASLLHFLSRSVVSHENTHAHTLGPLINCQNALMRNKEIVCVYWMEVKEQHTSRHKRRKWRQRKNKEKQIRGKWKQKLI